jgi:signal transduction histidine kinase
VKSRFPYLSLSTVFLLVFLLIPSLGLVQRLYDGTDKIDTARIPQYEISDGWEYQWGNPKNGLIPDSGWKTTHRPINPPQRDKRQILWLKHTLPYGAWKVPTLLIDGKGVLLTFEAFLDDRMIYRFGKLTSSGEGNISGITSHLIPLGDDFKGKNLIFRVFSDYANIGIRGNVVLGSKSDLIQRIIKTDFNRFIIGLFMIFIGILDLIIYKESLKDTGSVSMFGILAVSIGFYTLNVTAIKDLMFYAPIFWFNIYIAAMSLIPVGALGFVWQTFRPMRGNFFHRAWQFHLCYAFLCQMAFFLILNSLLPMSLGSMMLNALRVLLILEMLLIVGLLVKDAFIKKSGLARVYLYGFIPIILSGTHDALVGLGKIESSYSFTPWALIFFILSQEIIKRRQNIRTRYRLKTYAGDLEEKSREKEELIKDLHDGIGGMTTNIKFLSQMGLTNSSIEEMKKSLSDISALSSDCLDEIGSFMQTLDEEETDWFSVAKTLRHTGEKMVTPLGLSLDFKKNISRDVKHPDRVLFLNLLRIYKEALTNITKHSKGTAVFIKLDVNLTHILLIVKDDGMGFGDNMIKGRGIDNMKARARKLGGKLSIDSKKGTCVTLEIQL